LRVTDTVSSNATDIFYVDAKGKLYAKNADIEGTIHAKAGGTIGGFTIGDTYITSNTSKTSHSTSVANSVYVGTDGIGLGQNQFYVNNTGYLTAHSGNIGGWELSSTSLSSGNLTLSTGGTITTKGEPYDTGYYSRTIIKNGEISCELVSKDGASVSQKTYLYAQGLYRYHIGTNGQLEQVLSVSGNSVHAEYISGTNLSATNLSATNLSCNVLKVSGYTGYNKKFNVKTSTTFKFRYGMLVGVSSVADETDW
jgi:hypothetical protein